MSGGSERTRAQPAVREHAAFLAAFLRDPFSTGSVAPSSRWLAERMVEQAGLAGARTVVELGPGTGAITRAIVRELPDDTLFLAVEANAIFAADLARDFPRASVVNDTAERLPDRIDHRQLAIGAPLPPSRHGDINNVRAHGLHGVESQTQPIHHARPRVLDEHVRQRRQLQRHRAPFRPLEIEGQAFLAAIVRNGLRGHAGDRRAEPANPIALGRLDLHDPRAVLGEVSAARWAGDALADIEDDEPLQRLGLGHAAFPPVPSY